MSYNRPGNGWQNTSPAVLNIIIINVIVFFAQMLLGGLDDESRITDLFALHHYKSDEFKLHQVITHMFMHGSVLHLLFNMFALWTVGSIIERLWDPKRFLLFYFACGIGAAIVQIASYAYTYRHIDNAALTIDQINMYQSILRRNATLGASGAIMGVVAAFGYLFPDTRMMVIPIPVPIKAKWLVLGYIAIDVFSGVAGKAGDNIAHFAHVGGALTGFLIVYFAGKRKNNSFS